MLDSPSFLNDLSKFSENIRKILLYSKSLDAQLAELLPRWYDISVEYLPRAVNLLGSNLHILLHASLLGKTVTVEPHRNAQDIMRFVNVASLSDQPSSHIFDEEDTVHVRFIETNEHATMGTISAVPNIPGVSSYVTLNTNQSNPFCMAWGQRLYSRQATRDPLFALQLRHEIDECKVQVLAQLNSIQQRIFDARSDYYALYKAYSELKENPNQDVLLMLLLKDPNNDTETKEVLQVIYSKDHHLRAPS